MKKTLLILIFAFPFFVFAQQDSLSSGVYSWKEPVKKNSKTILSAVLFEGSTYDMEWLQMSANSIPGSETRITVKVPMDQEELLIIKSGILKVARDSVYSLVAGSVGLFMPGETYTLQNSGGQSCTFYLMKYRSKSPVDIARGTTSGGSLIRDWSNIEFKPHDKGGRRDFFERPTAMCKRFEMHVTTLREGLKSHDPHTHRAAEIIIVIDGNTEMQIGDKLHKGKKGSVYYLGSTILHGIRNDGVGDCSYFAFQFE